MGGKSRQKDCQRPQGDSLTTLQLKTKRQQAFVDLLLCLLRQESLLLRLLQHGLARWARLLKMMFYLSRTRRE